MLEISATVIEPLPLGFDLLLITSVSIVKPLTLAPDAALKSPSKFKIGFEDPPLTLVGYIFTYLVFNSSDFSAILYSILSVIGRGSSIPLALKALYISKPLLERAL